VKYFSATEVFIMESSINSQRLGHRRRIRLVFSVVVVCLVAVAALVVPYLIRTAHAASPANICLQPPAGKDPATFADTQLKMYGVPHRPRGMDATQWRTLLSHLKHRVCTPLPAKPSHARPHSPATTPVPMPSQKTASDCDFCWSGYEAYGTNYNFADVWGFWQVPCVPANAPLGEDNYDFATWVGLGGDTAFNPSSAGLPQVGVDATGFTVWGARGAAFPSATYQAFVDNPGAFMNSQENPVFDVNCNDWVMAEVSAPNIMWIGDFTNGQYYQTAYGPTDTTTAECIVEESQGSPVGLLDFGTQTFSQCFADDATSNVFGGIDQFTHKAWTSTKPISTYIPGFGTLTRHVSLASPGPISYEGSFTDNWLNP
jgi:hypothetical protein